MEFVDAALAAGLSELGISDHAPQTPEPFDDWRMRDRQLPEYFSWIETAKSHAAGRIPIRAGLECDWLSGNETWIENLAARYPWDYLIGSVHYLGSWNFDNPHKLSLWNSNDWEDVWTRYWKAYAEMAASGLFDILGHPDLIKKFGHIPPGDLTRFYEPAIDAIASSGAAIEINTAGWHKPCADAYPATTFLELSCSAGIPLVISSDAHAPAEVARDFASACSRAKAAGYRETLLFERRKRTSERIP